MIIQPTFGDLVTALFRRKTIVLATTLVVAGLGTLYLLIATPQYRSEAVLVVRFDQAAIPATNLAKDVTPAVTASNERQEVVKAHVDILQSQDLAREVINSIGLQTMYPHVLSSPPWFGTPMDAALKKFSKALLADPELQGDDINLSFIHPKPQIAKLALERLIEGYMRREGKIFSASEYEFQKDQLDQAAKRVNEAQAELAAFKASTGITSFGDQVTETIKERRDISFNLQNNEVALEQAINHRDALRKLILTIPSSVANSATEKYRSEDDAQTRLSDLQEKERQMLATYRRDSPMLAALEASISTAKADLDSRHQELASRDAAAPNLVYQSIQTDLLRATADANADQKSVDLLKQQVSDMDQQLAHLEGNHSELSLLMRNVDIADAADRAIALHFEDSRVAANRLKGGISHGAVIDSPTLPYKSANPRYILMIIAFAAASIIIGVGAGLTSEYMDDRFATAAEVMHTLNVPVLAAFESAT